MKSVIIFGATGTVGSYAALHFKKLGYIVYAVGKRVSDNGFFESFDIPYFSCDIANKKAFHILPTNVDIIFHFAGVMPAKMEGYEVNTYVRSIIDGTINILEYGRKVNIERVIFSQSIADILYKFGSTEPISADSVMKFPLIGDHSIYSICKNTSVNLIQHYAATYNFKHFILRFPTIYAYRESPYYYVDGEKKWLGYRLLINNAISGKDIEVWGDSTLQKDMVYIKDLLQILEGTVESNVQGGIYNVGTGIGTSLEDFIDAVISVFSPADKHSSKIYLPNRPNSPQFILDVSKTIRELNYKPIFTTPTSWLEDFKEEMFKHRFIKLYE